METDEDSSGALGAGEHGGGSHQLQSPGSNPLGVGQGGNAAEGYVAKYAAKSQVKSSSYSPHKYKIAPL